MRTINFFLGIISLLQVLTSCERKPFEKVNFQDGDFKLYFFVPSPYSSNSDNLNDFISKYNNFYITDSEVLGLIKKDIIGNKKSRKIKSESIYILRLLKSSKLFDGAILDVEGNNLLSDNGWYSFNTKRLEDYEYAFNKLCSFEINCLTISNTKRFFEFVEGTNGFVYGDGNDKRYPEIDFEGIIEVTTDVDYFGHSSDYKVAKRKLENDFKELGEVRLLRISWKEGGTIVIRLACEKDFSNSLPSEYRIKKQFTDSLDLPLRVYDIEKNKIVSFFEKNGISDYELYDLNENNYW